MAHQPKPFYRSARHAFYVQLGTRQVKLAAGPNDPSTEKAAWAAFHALMTARAAESVVAVPPPVPAAGHSAATVLDKYLDWCEKHRGPRTFEWSKGHIQSFCDHLGARASAPAAELRPFHVVEWVDSKPTWGANQKRGAVVAVTRPFAWATKLGYLDRNPVAGVERPKAVRREAFVTTAQYAALLAEYSPADPFRDLLAFLWETGARPQEARHLERRHYNPAFARFDIPPQEAKGKARWRIIRLTADAKALVERRLPACRSKVFENEDGNPWTASAVNCRFQRLKRRTGLAHFAYSLRHGFCQRKLEEGHDHLTVAELMGHVNGVQVAATYSHLGKADQHLRKALAAPGTA